MAVTITRTPRTNVVLRTNECLNPRMGSYSNWMSSGSGASSPAATDTYNASAGYLDKYWNNGAPTNVDGAGWYMNHANWTAGQTKIVSGYVYFQNWQPKMRVQFFFYNGSTRIGQSDGGAQQLLFDQGQNKGEGRVWHSATAPAGTTRTEIQISAVQGNLPPQGQGMGLHHVLIEPGSTLDFYFDGSTYANGNGTQSTIWAGAADASPSQLRDWNPLDVIAPQGMDGWDEARPTGNTFIPLIDGGLVAILQPSGPRRGTIKLLFGGISVPNTYDARLAARRAVTLLSSGATFVYSDPETSDFGGVTFATAGDVRAYPQASRNTWSVDVPYQEF